MDATGSTNQTKEDIYNKNTMKWMNIGTPLHAKTINAKTIDSLGGYIKENFYDKLWAAYVKNIVAILDDPMMKYKDDGEKLDYIKQKFMKTTRLILPKFSLPVIEAEWLDFPSDLRIIKSMIKQQILKYKETIKSTGPLTEVIQKWSKNVIDATKSYMLQTYDVPSYQKSLVANMMVLLLIEEEVENNPAVPHKIIGQIQ
jgi:hypothetical protein